MVPVPKRQLSIHQRDTFAFLVLPQTRHKVLEQNNPRHSMLNILFDFYTLVYKTKQRTHICFLF